MGSTREKGKIPNSEWPKIVARYNGGETIASIGRAYGCTAPAIRYIVKRSGMLRGDAVGKRSFGAPELLIEQQSSRSDIPSDPGGGRARSEIAGLRLAGRATREPVLGTELRKRVSGDVASFLVALDQAVLDGSIESIANLQEATDCLMRSTARTRLELERQLSRYEGATAERDGRKKVASAPPRDA